jgi:hypothetical protein
MCPSQSAGPIHQKLARGCKANLRAQRTELLTDGIGVYRGKRALVLIGTDDVDHPRELDVRIADWLNENGANADFWFLGDRGVSGNGHMMMIESNSDAVAKLVLSWVEGT